MVGLFYLFIFTISKFHECKPMRSTTLGV